MIVTVGNERLNFCVVVPWHDEEQREAFQAAWNLTWVPQHVLFQQDTDRSGCARTKNAGLLRAISMEYDAAIVLDDDCYPTDDLPKDHPMDAFIRAHARALEPQPVELFQAVTAPPSRGTPYHNRHVSMPVAASMGFWTNVGDLDAAGQLIHGAKAHLVFTQTAIHGRYFPLCGMNLAFRLKWWPWCQFVDVPRFDDIWQGFMWQKEAYATGHCFNLAGPLVHHARQSNVWANLNVEAPNLERNETFWSKVHAAPRLPYEELRRALGLMT